jgi:purine nucleoside phosphorylase
MNETFIPYRLAAHYLWDLLLDEGIEFPLIGIVCGSGLSELSKALEGKTRTVKYSEIPGYVCPKAVAILCILVKLTSSSSSFFL